MQPIRAELTNAQIADLKALIAGRLTQLEQQIAEASHMPGDDTLRVTADSDADRQVADVDGDLAIAALTRDVQERQSLDAALARMQRGSYGDCVDCGDAIGFTRLLAAPGAARCLRCQVRIERDHGAPPPQQW